MLQAARSISKHREPFTDELGEGIEDRCVPWSLVAPELVASTSDIGKLSASECKKGFPCEPCVTDRS